MTKRIIRLIVKTINGVCIACLLFVGVSTLAPVAAQNSAATPTPAGSNLALGKSAVQSSTLNDNPASYAVDGNTDGVFANNSVSSTQMNAQAWWQVDLGANYNLTDVRIWNRTDAGTESRLSNFYVLVSSVPFTSTDLTTARNQAGVSGFQVSGTAGRPGTVNVNRSGRYVRVQLVGTDFLNLAEVEVLVSGQGPTPTATLTPTITPTATMTPYPAPVNVALGKTASQSSVNSTYNAFFALDGNTSGYFADGPMAHTNDDYQAWWQVDLSTVYNITSINIWNRLDPGGETRVSNFYVLISDTPFSSPDLNVTRNQPGVSSYYISGPAGRPSTINVYRSGRYVRVQLTATNYLNIAEVQVFARSIAPTTTNIAIGKTASQSSTYGTYNASFAIDGNTSGYIANGSITHTNNDYQAWWQVDLNAVYNITSINIWNRLDPGGETRVSNFYVLVSDSPFSSNDINTAKNQPGVSSYYISGPAGSPSTVNVYRTGRYIRVQLTATNYLNIAEVQVFSGGLAPATTNIAIGKTASQSSTYSTYNASFAIDGNTSGYFVNGPMAHTNNDYQAWWQVDLGSVYDISSVNVWNRLDPGGETRVSNFYILVSDNPFLSTDLNTARNQSGVSSYYISGPAGSPSTINVFRSGRYVRVQLTATNYLNIAEVQVFSSGPVQ